MAETIDWRPPPHPRPKRRGGFFLLAVIGLLLLAGGTSLSYYVEALWYGSLGVADVFWKGLNLRAGIFGGFAVVSFLVLYGSFRALKPEALGDMAGLPILINGQPIRLPAEPRRFAPPPDRSPIQSSAGRFPSICSPCPPGIWSAAG